MTHPSTPPSAPCPDSFMARRRLDLACGLGLLSRLPVNWLLSPAQRASTALWPLSRSIWCWPVLGAALGGLVGAVFCLLRLCHVAALPAAGLALAFQCVLTGGLHEDGLADMADGCGGTTRERRLEIMRDSRIGSYGVLALCLSLLVRASAVAALPACAAMLALAISGCLARAALLVLPASLPPARPDGLAHSLTPLPRGPLWVGLGLAAGSVVGLAGGMGLSGTWADASIGTQAGAWTFVWTGAGTGHPSALFTTLLICLVAAGATLAAATFVGFAARRLLGGYTGDVLGAAAVLTECCILAGLTALL